MLCVKYFEDDSKICLWLLLIVKMMHILLHNLTNFNKYRFNKLIRRQRMNLLRIFIIIMFERHLAMATECVMSFHWQRSIHCQILLTSYSKKKK